MPYSFHFNMKWFGLLEYGSMTGLLKYADTEVV